MTHALDSIGMWFTDYYLLSAVLLLLPAIATRLTQQPIHRLAIIKSTLFSLALLAGLCALPSWSIIHLLTARSVASTALPIESPSEQANLKHQVVLTDGESKGAQPGELQQFQNASVQQPVATRTLSWPATLAAAQIVGAGCVIAWLAIGMIAAIRLRFSSATPPQEILAVFTNLLAGATAKTRKTELLTSDRIEVPVAIGVFRPTILLPSSFALPNPTLPAPHSELAPILAHELAHIRNHDLHWLAASRALMVLLWSQPLFWFARRRMRLDQESLADVAAADITSREQYAEQLVTWARNLRNRPVLRVAAAVGLWESPSQLRRRLALLLNNRITIVRSCPRSWKLVTAAAFALASFSLSMVTLQPSAAAKAEPTTKLESIAEKLAQIVAEPAKAVAATDKPTPNTVAGQALNDKKEPIAGAEVFLFRYDSRDSSRKLIGQAKSNDEGRFQFDHVIKKAEFPNDKYPSPNKGFSNQYVQCIVRHPGLVPFESMTTPAQVAQQGMHRAVVMSPANTLTGRITDGDGVPIVGALVSVGHSFGGWDGIQSARTDSDGNYKVKDLAPFDAESIRKQQEVARASAGFLASPEVVTVSSPDFATKQVSLMKVPGRQDIQLEAPAIIEGRIVFDEPQPVAREVIVRAAGAITADTPKDFATDQLLSPVETVRANQNGTYRFTNLPPGTYAVSAQASDWVHRDIPAMLATAGAVTKLPLIIFTKGGFISVRPVDAKTRKPVPIEPQMTAFLIAHSNEPWFATNNQAVEANAKGRFDLQVPAGKQSILAGAIRLSDFSIGWTGHERPEVTVLEGQTVEVDVPVEKFEQPPAKIPGMLADNQTEVAEDEEKSPSAKSDRTPTILSYGDGKPDGKKSYGGSGFMIEFEMPEGVTKIKGIRIHSSRYGVAQAPNEDFEITFLSDKRDEVLHTESAPYKLFKRGKENWVRIPFKEDVELPKKFWVALDFNADQTKGVYVSYDTSTKGEHSRVGLAGDDKDPKNTDFAGDWMIQVLLATPEKSK